MQKNLRFLRPACALLAAMLCLVLASCGRLTGIPFVIRNESGLDLTASLYIVQNNQSSSLLKGYTLAAGSETEVSVPRNLIAGDWHITLTDSQGRSYSFRDLPTDSLGESAQVSLRYEQDQLVFAVDWGNGAVSTLYPLTSATQLAEEGWLRYRQGELSYAEYLAQDFWLHLEGGNPRKYTLVYGDANARGYTTQEEAKPHMVQVTFPIWKLSGSQKVSSTATIWINSVGGYSWRGDGSSSEHNQGLAIDINPTENYQIRYGTVVVGSFWDPSSSPYSIPAGSSVVRIFEAHGWSWGGDAWAGFTEPSTEGNHDYMHFSYFGT